MDKTLPMLARQAILDQLTGQEHAAEASDLETAELMKPAACFVSLKKNGQLRGCIGTIYPQEASLAAEIARNAVSAAMMDPRFPPVKLEELPDIEMSVDVLTVPEKVTSYDDLDPKRYGVIVRRGDRQGLLLPDLEGVDSVKHQVEIACHKAGIHPHEPSELYRFEVIRHKESE